MGGCGQNVYLEGDNSFLSYLILPYITLYYIILYYIILYYIILHYITLHYIILHYITLYYITLHYITLYYITLHYIILYYIILYYITLHYIILSHISCAINCHVTLISQMILSLYPLPINCFFYFNYSIILSYHVQGASPGSSERFPEGKTRPQRGHRQFEDNAKKTGHL